MNKKINRSVPPSLIIAVAVAAVGIFCLSSKTKVSGQSPPQQTECDKTYVVEPGGARLTAKIKINDLPAKGVQGVEWTEKQKYGGAFGYRPTDEPVTRQQNCAGYVLAQLFPTVRMGNFSPEEFYRKVVLPFQVRPGLNWAAGDVAVYIRNGQAQHVAVVTGPAAASGDDYQVPILSKDGNERPYHGFVPIASPWSSQYLDDPLVRAHVNPSNDPNAKIVIYHLDRSKISIKELAPGRCNSAPPANQPTTTGQTDNYVKGRLLAGPVTILAKNATPTEVGLVLEMGKAYFVEGQGTCSLWDGQSDGCDSVFRHRAPAQYGGTTLVVWGQLKLINPTVHLSELIEKQTGKPPVYNAGHIYHALVIGEGKPLKAIVYDGGGYGDNHGQLQVSVYEAIKAR